MKVLSLLKCLSPSVSLQSVGGKLKEWCAMKIPLRTRGLNVRMRRTNTLFLQRNNSSFDRIWKVIHKPQTEVNPYLESYPQTEAKESLVGAKF